MKCFVKLVGMCWMISMWRLVFVGSVVSICLMMFGLFVDVLIISVEFLVGSDLVVFDVVDVDFVVVGDFDFVFGG